MFDDLTMVMIPNKNQIESFIEHSRTENIIVFTTITDKETVDNLVNRINFFAKLECIVLCMDYSDNKIMC